MNVSCTTELMIKKKKHSLLWVFSTGRKGCKIRLGWKLNLWLTITIDYSLKSLTKCCGYFFFGGLSDPYLHVFIKQDSVRRKEQLAKPLM